MEFISNMRKEGMDRYTEGSCNQLQIWKIKLYLFDCQNRFYFPSPKIFIILPVNDLLKDGNVSDVIDEAVNDALPHHLRLGAGVKTSEDVLAEGTRSVQILS